MKKRSLWLLVAGMLSVTLMTGCVDENTVTAPVDPESGFIGTVKVAEAEVEMNGTTMTMPEYMRDGIVVDIEVSETDRNKYDIVLEDVTFAEKMPEMTIIIPAVAITDEGKIVGNDIIPLYVTPMGNVAVERYLVTNLQGKITADKKTGEATGVVFSLNFGPYPTTYTGLAR